MMTWSVETVERNLLSGEICIIARPESEVIEAVERAQRLLGEDWIASQVRNQKGLAVAMRIVGMGLRLQGIEGLPGNEELLTKIRILDSSAEAELTAIYLFRSGSCDVEVELFPPVGNRIADFRMRKGKEEWTTVEVTEATESVEQKRLNAILMQLTTALKSLNFPFSLEIILLREPSEEEVTELCRTLPQFCENKEIQNARLYHDLGWLLLNHVPIGQLPNSEIPETANLPSIGLAAFFRDDQVVAVTICFSDERAEDMLTQEARQLPSGKRGLIMISGPSSRKELHVWEPLIRRRFQPRIHTRVGGVCLFNGGMVPAHDAKSDWKIQAHLVLNPYAKAALPPWIEQSVRVTDDDFNRSFSRVAPK
jgi:hypothetical protein